MLGVVGHIFQLNKIVTVFSTSIETTRGKLHIL